VESKFERNELETRGMNSDIRELIRLAFWAARERGKPDWWRMTTAVLKNRLLSLTDRQFNEEDYGARTLFEFASKFPELISVDTTTYPPEVELRPTRIRADLWRAAIDYRSGTKYVWDRLQRRARERKASDDSSMILPTLTREAVASWREEFKDRQRSATLPSEIPNLERWAQFGLATQSLPDRLQGLWNREQSWRVWEHLSSWFVQNLPPADRPTIVESSDPAKRGIRARLVAFGAKAAERRDVDPDSDALRQCRDASDWLGVGEILSRRISAGPLSELEGTFAKVIAAWAMPVQPIGVGAISDLIDHLEEMAPEQAAAALINASYRLKKNGVDTPPTASDLIFRLSSVIESVYQLPKQRGPSQLLSAAIAKLASAHDQLLAAVQAFRKTSAVTAKAMSIDLLRASHQYRFFALSAEVGYLRELDILLGVSFRKFCESCERHASQDTARRADELRTQTERLLTASGHTRSYSMLWSTVVKPVVTHVSDLVEEGTRQSEELNRPSLGIVRGPLKVDLGTCGRPTTVSCRLLNNGHGRALRVDMVVNTTDLPVEVELVEPSRPFELAGSSTQVLIFTVILYERCEALRIPLAWICSDSSDRRLEFADYLELEQQRSQPDWDALLLQPPYTINPVKRKERLFGRDTVLKRLILHATSGTSTFLWGQKRVGKTSVLQVLAAELERSGNIVCIFLRMGELVALHEGQIAHTIAVRLNTACANRMEIPSEEYFGAGLNRLIPLIEELNRRSDKKLIVIIDEFDDLDPAFYTGERGRQFVKALRSLSEVGLTFFFVGSERMDTIYSRHSSELNKWVNVSLDRIEAFVDCKELIVAPVSGEIDYEDSAVAFIVDYCAGNPFYMHLFCFEAFKRCVEDHRTFVSSADVQVVRQYLLRTLGRTNFAHFWEDNPELGHKEFAAQGAENCLVLACIASLGGRYEDVDDVFDAQETLGLSEAELMTRGALRQTVERLRRRRVLALNPRDNRVEVSLPIFREWLGENSEQIVPIWREFARRDLNADEIVVPGPRVAETGLGVFPISEDELLAVSQRLVYCGRQKDVAEVRQWLRQFDDDSRIEVAFSLLRRLAEQGYMSEGARGRMLTMVEEAIQHRRTMVGGQAWKIVRGRKDNLCLTYVDSETKSGASTARELAKRIRPGKVADGTGIDAWLRAHAQDDPLVVIVDDFAGTGTTLETGLYQLFSRLPRPLVEDYVREGRMACYCLFSFPEAIDRLRKAFPQIEFYAAHVFGDDVRALDTDSDLFESDEERVYVRDILLQIGRELLSQMPLGWGDMAALVAFHNTIPNNTLPIFWCEGRVNDRVWQPLFPRA
jgi:hypothetical protein